jgi:septum formation protein
MTSRRLVLASRSPRRVELLRDAGYVFDIDPADIDEDAVPASVTEKTLATYLATEKARVVAQRQPDAVVLGADTVVFSEQGQFGKADSPAAARAMLRALMGQRQSVITGVAMFTPGEVNPQVEAVVSVVEMRTMTDAELDAYLASDQWRGKAGAYGIQDHDPAADPFVRLVSGDFTNVMGLPMPEVIAMLRSVDIEPAGV